ncbi:peptide ABC transporter substrate-binding protein [Arthrobacter sp. MYb224]|uniref:ABC transporter substrate-binding protein n=1 Tax=unclassified Arthrobacter TaxID=235627 RepID=UPI000CFCA28D|nr:MULTISPECIES: ABC transporter substrate-binding protein [unclassified Arthrobacter]PRA00583.1 peptide ABC transporter substrate-binding protein [Arthrobacter sp. MYb224]PRA04796.1 peptide ABC transporter substrate-binding protein [Arthrobacter sp. MYb229]PRB52091.1 peptide ABC transporter substrate-binding protein [Arthrobacter sp. MYb216]
MQRTQRATRLLTGALALPLAGALIAGCSTTSDPSATEDLKPVAGGTLVYASGDAEPNCLDPHVGGNYPQALVASQFMESLFSKDAKGEIVPWLAEKSEVSEDGLTRTITLREGISFHDGTPLTAEAIKANIEHLQDPNTASSTGYLAVGKVTEITIVDELTAQLELSAPDNALLESLSMPWTAIQSPEGLKRDQAANCAAPAGTGPFKVESWDRQQAVNLVRYEDYAAPAADPERAGSTAHLDGITWRFIPEAASRYAALQSGEVDVIDNPQPDTIATAADSGLGHLAAPRPGASNRVELNSSKAPFDDASVREAFIRSLDVNTGIDALYFNTAERSYSLLSSVEPLGISAEEKFGTDVERANQLLDEAGWTERDAQGYRLKDGKRLSLSFPVSTNQSVPAEQSLFEQMQAAAKNVGIEVKIDLLDLSSWYGALAKHEYDLVSAPYTKVGPSVLRILFHSDSTVPAPSGYFANNAQIKNPQLDRLLVEAEQTNDEAKRAELYERAQQIVLDGYYVIPLYDQQNHFLFSKNVHGMGETTAVSSPTYFNVFLNK